MKKLAALLFVAALASAQTIVTFSWTAPPPPPTPPPAPAAKARDQEVPFGNMTPLSVPGGVGRSFTLDFVPAPDTRLTLYWKDANGRTIGDPQTRIIAPIDPNSTDAIRRTINMVFPAGTNSGSVKAEYFTNQ